MSGIDRGQPSSWITRFAPSIVPGGQVLDLACGPGRHTAWLLEHGYRVTAVDRDVSGLSDLSGRADLSVIEADLESGDPFPCSGPFDGIVVTNYLFRPLLPVLVSLVNDQGWLLYETFAVGNERFGLPSNPDFLLRPGELLDAVRPALRVIAYEDVEVTEPRPAMVQRIAARRSDVHS